MSVAVADAILAASVNGCFFFVKSPSLVLILSLRTSRVLPWWAVCGWMLRVAVGWSRALDAIICIGIAALKATDDWDSIEAVIDAAFL